MLILNHAQNINACCAVVSNPTVVIPKAESWAVQGLAALNNPLQMNARWRAENASILLRGIDTSGQRDSVCPRSILPHITTPMHLCNCVSVGLGTDLIVFDSLYPWPRFSWAPKSRFTRVDWLITVGKTANVVPPSVR